MTKLAAPIIPTSVINFKYSSCDPFIAKGQHHSIPISNDINPIDQVSI